MLPNGTVLQTVATLESVLGSFEGMADDSRFSNQSASMFAVGVSLLRALKVASASTEASEALSDEIVETCHRVVSFCVKPGVDGFAQGFATTLREALSPLYAAALLGFSDDDEGWS